MVGRREDNDHSSAFCHCCGIFVKEKQPQKKEEKEKQIVHLSGRKQHDRKYKPDGMNCEVYFLVLTQQIYVQRM